MSDNTRRSSIIYGRNPVLEALENKEKLERVYLKDSITGELEKDVRNQCRDLGIPLKKVPQIKLDKLARRNNHQGLVAIASIIDYVDLDMLIPFLFESGKNPLLLLLDNITDVRNIGAIARNAEVMGGHGMVLSGKYAGMVNEDSVKTSAGAIRKIHVCRTKNTVDTIESLRSYGIKVVGTSLTASKPISSIDFTGPTCIVLGSEGDGIHRSVEEACDELSLIPQAGTTDSLNVSVAAGILLYEACRQRG